MSIPAVVCEERATKREPKRTAALRVAPKMPQGFVTRRPHFNIGMARLRPAYGATPLGLKGTPNRNPG